MVEFQNISVCGTIVNKGKFNTTKGYAIWFVLEISTYRNAVKEVNHLLCHARSNQAIDLSHCVLGDRVFCTLEFQSSSYTNQEQEKKYSNYFKVLNVAKLEDKNTDWLEKYNQRQKKQERDNELNLTQDSSLLE